MFTKSHGTFLLILLLTWFTASPSYAVFGEIVITGGGDDSFCKTVSNRLTDVVNQLETGDLEPQLDAFTPDGYKYARDLLKEVPMENASRRPQKTHLLTLPDGGYEVRDIKVKVRMGDTPGNPYEYLVFELNKAGLITDIRFAIERTHTRRILDEGKRLNDFARRQKILQTMEIFRTAYNRKDLDYLKQVYSDNAVIIVGHVVKQRDDLPDMLKTSGMDKKKIEFLRKSKAEYLADLGRAFARNATVEVVFDSLEITRHNDDPYLYGVTVKQNWYSSTYSDTGWVFLLWDFKDEANPTIYVRSWQPETFEDGSIINLYQFRIIRKDD